jgi:hypothetical protein
MLGLITSRLVLFLVGRSTGILSTPTWIQPIEFQNVITYILATLFGVQHTTETIGNSCCVVSKWVCTLGFVESETNVGKLQDSTVAHLIVVCVSTPIELHGILFTQHDVHSGQLVCDIALIFVE